jgi:hypothetical protein
VLRRHVNGRCDGSRKLSKDARSALDTVANVIFEKLIDPRDARNRLWKLADVAVAMESARVDGPIYSRCVSVEKRGRCTGDGRATLPLRLGYCFP